MNEWRNEKYCCIVEVTYLLYIVFMSSLTKYITLRLNNFCYARNLHFCTVPYTVYEN